MTYGFRPDNWPVFQAELKRRGINTTDIEKIEMRPTDDPAVAVDSGPGVVEVTVTLRSGRVEAWRQLREPAG
jgi:hypothetical protein